MNSPPDDKVVLHPSFEKAMKNYYKNTIDNTSNSTDNNDTKFEELLLPEYLKGLSGIGQEELKTDDLTDAKIAVAEEKTNGRLNTMQVDFDHKFDKLEKAIETSQNKILDELKRIPSIWSILGGTATFIALAIAALAYIDTSFYSGQNSQKAIANAESISLENKKVNEDQNKKIDRILEILEKLPSK